MTTAVHLDGEEDAARSLRDTVGAVIRRQVVRSLGTPSDLLAVHVRPVDLAFFIAEHDDHHLARISELRRLFKA